MSRQQVKISGYSLSKTIQLWRWDKIGQNFIDDGELYYYYVENNFNDEGSVNATLYAFRVVKTTNCFHFLSNGQRLQKKGYHDKLKETPEDAMKAAIKRARTYLNILMNKSQNVIEYLSQCDKERLNRHELKTFEYVLNRVDNVDNIPDHILMDEADRVLKEIRELCVP